MNRRSRRYYTLSLDYILGTNIASLIKLREYWKWHVTNATGTIVHLFGLSLNFITSCQSRPILFKTSSQSMPILFIASCQSRPILFITSCPSRPILFVNSVHMFLIRLKHCKINKNSKLKLEPYIKQKRKYRNMTCNFTVMPCSCCFVFYICIRTHGYFHLLLNRYNQKLLNML